MEDTLFFIFEMLGTLAFAISGAMVAIEKKMDLLGVAILGMTTAVGGGIIRDLIIGVIPPQAFRHPIYALVAIAVSLVTFFWVKKAQINMDSFGFIIIDAIGLGVFTVIGVKAGMGYNNLFLQVFLGTLTGVGGGVLRDIFASDKPFIFVKHFYACACIIGALVCALLYGLDANLAMFSGLLVIVVLRILAAKYKWNLPRA